MALSAKITSDAGAENELQQLWARGEPAWGTNMFGFRVQRVRVALSHWVQLEGVPVGSLLGHPEHLS